MTTISLAPVPALPRWLERGGAGRLPSESKAERVFPETSSRRNVHRRNVHGSNVQ